jgi:hypothetical protein
MRVYAAFHPSDLSSLQTCMNISLFSGWDICWFTQRLLLVISLGVIWRFFEYVGSIQSTSTFTGTTIRRQMILQQASRLTLLVQLLEPCLTGLVRHFEVEIEMADSSSLRELRIRMPDIARYEHDILYLWLPRALWNRQTTCRKPRRMVSPCASPIPYSEAQPAQDTGKSGA